MSRIARVHKSLLSTAGANPSTHALQRSSRGASCQLRNATRFVTVILAIRRCRVHGACAPQAPPPCHMHGRRPRACPKAPEKGYRQHPAHTDFIINHPPGRRTVGAPHCKGRPVSAAPRQRRKGKREHLRADPTVTHWMSSGVSPGDKASQATPSMHHLVRLRAPPLQCAPLPRRGVGASSRAGSRLPA